MHVLGFIIFVFLGMFFAGIAEAAAAQLEFSASKWRIGIGDPLTLTWKSDEGPCIASGGWEGAKETSGSVTLYPQVTATYLFECGPETARVKKTKKVTVVPKPDILVWADKTFAESKSPVVLSWEATNATSCSLLKGKSSLGTLDIKGSKTVNPTIKHIPNREPITTATYTVRCNNGSGAANTADITIHLTPEPRVTLSASQNVIQKGTSITLTWRAQNVPACYAEGMWMGMRELSGTQVVTPTQSGLYTLTCGHKTISVSIVVNEKPETPTLQPTIVQQPRQEISSQPAQQPSSFVPPPPLPPLFLLNSQNVTQPPDPSSQPGFSLQQLTPEKNMQLLKTGDKQELKNKKKFPKPTAKVAPKKKQATKKTQKSTPKKASPKKQQKK
ncbi:hypothetical protein HY620_02790 [Candidatus Uhrbacteria bacterium]|nr:hypothetical protein [Candidatus Uhrbacteria bacterium]